MQKQEHQEFICSGSTQDVNTKILDRNNKKISDQSSTSPGLIKRALNLLDTIIAVAQSGGELFVSEEIQQTRFNICRECDEFWLPQESKGSAQCRKCGCFIYLKTAIRAANCPLERWSSTDVKDVLINSLEADNSIANIISEACSDNSPSTSGWRIRTNLEPSQMWIYLTNEGVTSPTQGWKLHISASVLSAKEVLQRTLPVLLAEDANFKVAASLAKLDYLNQGQGGLTQIGKFITVYPNDDAQAVRLASSLHEVTQGQGLRYPTVPSDRPLKFGSLVHYRYGGFGNQLIQTPLGQIFPAISDPNGELLPDHRRTSYSVVSWAVDPFITAGTANELTPENLLLNGRYLLLGMVHQSPFGGVYLATADIPQVDGNQFRR